MVDPQPRLSAHRRETRTEIRPGVLLERRIARRTDGAGRRTAPRHWASQRALDLAPVGDFAFYDQVLDMSFTLGNLPERVQDFHGDALDNYFRVARGRSARAQDHAGCCGGVAAGEMTKWFDTNYHYIVPEFTAHTSSSSTVAPAGATGRSAGAGRGQAGDHRPGHVSVARQGQGRFRQAGAAAAPAAGLCALLDTLPRRAWNGCRSTSRSW
jgi:hypothetical protein